MPPTPSSSSPRLLALLVGGVLTCYVAAGAAGLVLVALFGVEGEAAGAFLRRPEVLAWVMFVQYAGMVGVAVVMFEQLGGAPALGRPPGRHMIAGIVGGIATVSVASGLAALLIGAFPDFDTAALERIGEAFAHGPLVTRLALAAVVALAAPLAEELVFRGVLWEILSKHLSGVQVLVVTSLVFAAWHLQPFHAATLLPTAFLFGLLRWRTGSVLPSMVAHGVNNGVGAALLLTAGDATAVETTLHLPSFVAAVLVYVALFIGLRGPPDPPSARP